MRIPSTSNTTPGVGGYGGTPGGVPHQQTRSAIGNVPGRRPMHVGPEMYLWILVLIEVALMGWLRNHFRRHHGG